MAREANIKHPGFMSYKAKDLFFTENSEARLKQLIPPSLVGILGDGPRGDRASKVGVRELGHF